MPLATPVSAVVFGLKMNARSLYWPSPLMSPFTSGVYGVPDVMLNIPVSSRDGCTGHVAVAWMLWRRSRSDVAHGVMFGLPSVVPDRKRFEALPPVADVWSRERW